MHARRGQPDEPPALTAQARDELLYNAVVDFRAGRYGEAEEKSLQLQQMAPQFFPSLLLLGMIAWRTGRAADSIERLRAAVALDRRSADARNELAGVLRAEGRLVEAITEATHAVRLQPADPGSHNNLGLCYLAAGRVPLAITHFRRAISLDPGTPMFHHNLGLALQQQSCDTEAIAAYRQALSLDPGHAEALAHLGQLLFQHGQPEEGAACYERAAALQPDATLGAIHLAEALVQRGRAEEAEAVLRRAVLADPKSDLAFQVLGVLLQRQGRFEAAIGAFERAISLQPKRISAHLSLVMGKQIVAADRPRIQAMLALVDDPSLAAPERSRLHYALGKAYEDLGDYGEAARHFDRANEIERGRMHAAGRRFDRKSHKAMIDRTIAAFTPEVFAARRTTGADSELPVLIVGMPRSGTTLVEQILSSHPAVGAAGELSFWTDRQGFANPTAAGGLDEKLRQGMAGQYLALLRAASPEARHVTDKMPATFLVLGLIHLLLPGARIIHLRRDPIDTCVSIYTTAFGNPLDFAHDCADLVFFYEQYARLMAHWRRMIPHHRLLEIDYEALVADPEPITRAMLGFCGIDWDGACLHHEDNEHVIMTPSLWQARQPVYRHAVGRGRRYQGWFSDFRRLSDPAGVLPMTENLT